jgi:hypothetical protein
VARKEAKGTKQLGQSVDAELWDEFVAFCYKRGDTIRQHLEQALRRHLANPPSEELPPLPPAPPPAPPKKRGRPPKTKT